MRVIIGNITNSRTQDNTSVFSRLLRGRIAAEDVQLPSLTTYATTDASDVHAELNPSL